MEVLMGAAIRLWEDFNGDRLRRLARICRDGAQTRRLLALSAIYDGAPRSGMAKLGGVTPQIIRDNWLSNRVFSSYDYIVAHYCDAWNKLLDQPSRIRSTGMREWAHRS
jgi:hypothetical protein